MKKIQVQSRIEGLDLENEESKAERLARRDNELKEYIVKECRKGIDFKVAIAEAAFKFYMSRQYVADIFSGNQRKA